MPGKYRVIFTGPGTRGRGRRIPSVILDTGAPPAFPSVTATGISPSLTDPLLAAQRRALEAQVQAQEAEARLRIRKLEREGGEAPAGAGSGERYERLLERLNRAEERASAPRDNGIERVLAPILQGMMHAQASAQAETSKLLAAFLTRDPNANLTSTLALLKASEGSKSSVGELAESFREILALASEIGGGNQSGGLGELVSIARAALDRAPAAAPVQPEPKLLPPAAGGKNGNTPRPALNRVAKLLLFLEREIENKSDADTVAERIHDDFGLLPEDARTAILHHDPETILRTIAASVPPEIASRVQAKIASSPKGLPWILQVIETIRALETEDQQAAAEEGSGGENAVEPAGEDLVGAEAEGEGTP